MRSKKIATPRLFKIAALCVGVLAIAAVILWKQVEKSFQKEIDHYKELKVIQTLEALNQSVEVYRAEFGTYPLGISRTVINALQGNNPSKLRLIVIGRDQDGLPRDPWGEEYQILRKEVDTVPEFYSTGPDRIDEQCRIGSDDIRSTHKIDAQQAAPSNGG